VRRNVLEELVDDQQLILPARRLTEDGLEAWGPGARARLRGPGREGRGLTYVEGRTLSWLKVKVPNYREGERGWEPK
jgi:hypothetical protein